MVKGKVQTAVTAQAAPQPMEATEPRRNAEDLPAAKPTHEPEQRVNIAEEFYLEVTARPDVREILRRLAEA